MGNHGGASTRLRASEVDGRAKISTTSKPQGSRAFTLRNWPVSWRLFAVFMLTLAMGLVFGGLRVASAALQLPPSSTASRSSPASDRHTSPDAGPGGRTRQDGRNVGNAGALQHWYDATDAAAAKVTPLTAGVWRFLPGGYQGEGGRRALRDHQPGRAARRGPDQFLRRAVITDYAVPINAMMALNGDTAEVAN